MTRNKGGNQVTRKKVLLATATIEHPNLSPAPIDTAPAFAMRSSFAMSGYTNRARFVAFAKLKEHQKAGRRTLTKEVVEATWRARTAKIPRQSVGHAVC